MKTIKFDGGNLCYVPAIAEVSTEDGALLPVGIMFELMDTRDFDNEADINYPYIIQAALMLDNVNPAFNEADMAGIRRDCYWYCGGVPVDHVLQDEITIPGQSALESRFTLMEAKRVTRAYSSGTIAAQRGTGAEYTYLQFATVEAAEKYCNILLERAAGLAVMLGFILNRHINMAGRDGWSVLKTQLEGVGK